MRLKRLKRRGDGDGELHTDTDRRRTAKREDMDMLDSTAVILALISARH